MAVAAPSDEVIRLVEALGLRTKNTREVTLRMAVNEVVAVNTVEYVNGEQIDALAAELKERQYRLARWIPVAERLPEPDQEKMLLVCVECEDGNRSVDVARWRLDADGKPSWGDMNGSNQTIYGWSHLFVVAWMPLPDPPEVK